MKKLLSIIILFTLLLTACKQKTEEIITDEIVTETQEVTEEETETVSNNSEMSEVVQTEEMETVESQPEMQLNETTENTVMEVAPTKEEIPTERDITEGVNIPAPQVEVTLQPEPETYVDPAPNGYENTAPLNPQTGEVLQPGQSFDDGWGQGTAIYVGDDTGLF